MDATQALSQHIRSLEETLLHRDHSSDREALEQLLDPAFREVNPTGSETPRADVIAWLLDKSPDARWEFTGFQATALAQGLVMATYHARQVVPVKPESKGAQHCSLWREDAQSGNWRLVYHQSTKIH